MRDIMSSPTNEVYMQKPYAHLEQITLEFVNGNRPWPRPNVLSVKRVGANGEVELGLVIRSWPDMNTENTVFVANLFAVADRSADLAACQKYTYESRNELVIDGGWVVD